MQRVLDSFRLDGRLALITGSSAGIGLAIARGLAQAGARVVLNGRNRSTLRDSAALLAAEGMAIDWGPHGLTVNGIGPGYFKTELNANLVANPEFSDWLVQRTPSRRWGDVAELAGAAVFLASAAASFVNGHILYVDGGITASL
eukprot:gene12409-14562_t